MTQHCESCLDVTDELYVCNWCNQHMCGSCNEEHVCEGTDDYFDYDPDEWHDVQ